MLNVDILVLVDPGFLEEEEVVGGGGGGVMAEVTEDAGNYNYNRNLPLQEYGTFIVILPIE